MNNLWEALKRRKQITSNDDNSTQLARVLNLFDLVALSVGSTLGVGVWSLAGSVAYNHAGPAVIVSFLIAGFASSLAAFCYAEFAARIPKAGSAYVYTYVCVGEFVALTIGWNLVLEYIIATSSVARGLSGYIDELIDNRMSHFFQKLVPIHVSFLASYLDFFASALIILVSILLSTGFKKSTMLNNIYTIINLSTITAVIIAGAIKANPANWSIQKQNIPHNVEGGEGGFMPYGIAGIVSGAAKCFFGFVGFDCLAATGEEAINPKRNIPLAIILSFIIIFSAYFGVATVLTMMWPYYDLDPDAPFTSVFEKIGWIKIEWVITIGAIFALCSSLFGAMYPMPRILYSMSSDGLIFSVFKRVNRRTQVPANATLLSSFLAAIMALIFDLQQLIEMLSIGTLMAYTIVAVSILLLRYQIDNDGSGSRINNDNDNNSINSNDKKSSTFTNILHQLFNLNWLKEPNSLSSNIVKVTILLFALFTIFFCLLLRTSWDHFSSAHSILIVCGICLLFFLMIISSQPKNHCHVRMKVPAVPLLPLSSLFMNLYLMFNLDVSTWIRFVIWIMIGYVIYFTYGIRHSVESKRHKLEMKLNYRFRSMCNTTLHTVNT